jgi:ribosomal protein S18 acetylase RimI-like enzyme
MNSCPDDPSSSPTTHLPNFIRRAAADDLPRIVDIHRKSFGNFFLTRLGCGFLHRYYRFVLDYTCGILLVSEGQNTLQGFACGFVDPAGFYRRMWRAKLTFAVPVLSALVRHPCLINKVLYGVRRIHATAAVWPEGSCELSSIAVAPERAGSGLGKALIESFLGEARSMHARCVFLTTDADGNDAVNAFYRNVGFQHTRRFVHGEGRWMNEYVISACKTTDDPCGTLV